MAIQSFQLDPNHTHSYRKITRIGVDTNKNWNAPDWVDLVDDADNHVSGSTDIEATGITVATEQTGSGG